MTTETPATRHAPSPLTATRAVPTARIARSAALVVPATAVATAGVAAGARAVLDLDRSFSGTMPGPVAATAAVALLIGTAVFAFTIRRNPTSRRFERIATVVVALSLIGPVTTLWSQPPDGPGHHRPQTMATLITLHLITYAAALVLASRSRHDR